MSGSSQLRKNLRHYARVNAHFSAQLTTPTGLVRQADIENISRAGVMLSCNRETLETLQPTSHTPTPVESAQIELHFEVPVDAYHTETVSSTCKVIYVRRLARDRFQVGLSFGTLTHDNLQLITCYLKNQHQDAGKMP